MRKKYQKFFNSLICEDINDFTEERDGVLRHSFGSYSYVSYVDCERTIRKLFEKYEGNIFNENDEKIDIETAFKEDLLFDELGDILFDRNDETGDFDDMISAIQEILPNGKYFIYTQVCYEKLRFVGSFTVAATNSDARYESSEDFIKKSINELVEENAKHITQPYC